jgi:hypothetical protein
MSADLFPLSHSTGALHSSIFTLTHYLHYVTLLTPAAALLFLIICGVRFQH